MPPTTATANPPTAVDRMSAPPLATASTPARYATSDRASLNSASPSTSVRATRGRPSRRKTLVAASGIGWREDCAKRQRGGPAERRHQRLGHDRDDDHRHQHEQERQPDDRPDPSSQLARWRLGGGDEQQRRQEHEQDQIWFELQPRKAGHERERQAAQHEQRRVGQAHPAGEAVEDRDRDETDQDGGEQCHWL